MAKSGRLCILLFVLCPFLVNSESEIFREESHDYSVNLMANAPLPTLDVTFEAEEFIEEEAEHSVREIVRLMKGKSKEEDEDMMTAATELPFTRSNCRKFLLIMAKRLMKYLSGCIKQLKVDHPEKGGYDKYFQCAFRCAMAHVQMVDEKGYLTEASIEHFKKVHIPPRYYGLTKTILDQCVGVHSKLIKPISEDPTCTAYGDFFKCAQSYVGDNC